MLSEFQQNRFGVLAVLYLNSASEHWQIRLSDAMKQQVLLDSQCSKLDKHGYVPDQLSLDSAKMRDYNSVDLNPHPA